ncbi:MAG TPA: LUD domain-containing protein, partial [Streptosporangiaceae bacterium]
MSPREEVLARVRSALGAGAAPGQREDGPDVPRGYRMTTGAAGQDLLGLFTERLADYGSNVRRCPQGQLAATIAVALSDRGLRRVVVPPGIDLAGIELPGPESLRVTELITDDGLPAEVLDGCDGVITGTAVAIAESGTIVLDGSPGQGRRAVTLIPDYHLCVVRAGQVVGLVTQALPLLAPERPLTWISGPSATSDIELDRVQGVHGPRTL